MESNRVVCVCVCVRERERENEETLANSAHYAEFRFLGEI